MLRQCGDRVNVVAIGGSGLSLPDATLAREVARLMRDKTPTNVLHLGEPETGATASGQVQPRLADVLRKSNDNITFVLLSGVGSDLAGENDPDTPLLNNDSGNEPQDHVDQERLEGTVQRIERAFRGILDARDGYSPNTVVVTHLSQRFDEVILRATPGQPAHSRRIIVVPAEDTPAQDDGSEEMRLTPTGNAKAAERIFATVAAKCRGLFGSADGAGGPRHCQLQP